MSVIIVGNSPRLIGKGLGKYIDSFDTVVRMNNAQTGGEWEKDFGKKTDVLFSTQTYNKNLKPKQHIFFIPHLVERLPPVVKRVYKTIRSKYDLNPSTGFMCIFYFLEYFEKVNIINFDFQIGYEGGCHYYKDNEKPDSKTHSFIKERDIILSLIAEHDPTQTILDSKDIVVNRIESV